MNFTTAIKHVTGDDVDKARAAALEIRSEVWQAMNGDRRSLPKKAHDAVDAVIDADIYDDVEFPRFWFVSARDAYHELLGQHAGDDQEDGDDDGSG